MSKLTPLSTALAVALPFVLTACGGSDSAPAGNASTGNNVGSGTSTAMKASQTDSKTTQLNEKAPSGGQQATNTAGKTNENSGTFNKINPDNKTTSQTTTSKTDNKVTLPDTKQPSKPVITEKQPPVIEQPKTEAQQKTEQQKPNTDLTVNPTETKTGGTASSGSSSTNTSTNLSKETNKEVSNGSKDTGSVTVNSGSSTVPTPKVEEKDQAIDSVTQTTEGNNLDSKFASINNKVEVIDETLAIPTKPANPVNVVEKPLTIAKTFVAGKDVKMALNNTYGRANEDEKLYLDIFHTENRIVQDQVNKDQRDNASLNQVVLVAENNQTPKSLTSPTNRNKSPLLFVNYYPLVSGNAIVPLSHDTARRTFNGQDVKVAIIDGLLDENNKDFNYRPTRITYANDPVRSDADVIESNIKSSHGTKVGLIISGKQNQYIYGLAPETRLSYLLMPNIPDFTQMYNAVASGGYTVVNNSYSFNALNDYVYNFKATQIALQNIAKRSNAPLFVFATGNQPTFYNSKTNRIEIDQTRYQTGPSVQLNEFTNDYALRDILVTVTGLDIEVPKNIRDKYIEEVKIYNQLSPTQKATTPRPVITASTDFLVKSKTAIACGETFFSCISTMNSYYLPASDTDHNPSYISGTSYAAPQVTAAVAIIKQTFPWMNAGNLKTTLLTTASDIGEPGVDKTYGWGALNFGRAVKGPMQFAFGDFLANLNDDQGTYYFDNNIFGAGGLIVTANTNNKDGLLVLRGKNNYTGDTVVNAGRLAIMGEIKSRLKVRSAGTAYVSNSIVGSTFNNGIMVAKDTVVRGSYKQGSTATIILEADHPMRVLGTAYLDGTVALDNAGNYISAERKLHPIIKADSLIANTYFKNHVVNTAVDYQIYYDYTNGLVAADIYRKSGTALSSELSAKDYVSDQSIYYSGGKAIEALLEKADETSTQTSTSSTGKWRDANDYEPVRKYNPRLDGPLISLVSEDQSVDYSELSDYSLDSANIETVALTSSTNATTPANTSNIEDPNLKVATNMQKMSDEELKKFLVSSSGVQYAASLQTLADTSRQTSKHFTDTVLRSDVKDSKFNAYLDVTSGSHQLTRADTKLSNKVSQDSTTAGVYTSISGIKLGAGLTVGKATVDNTFDKDTIGKTTGDVLGFSLNAAKQIREDIYFGASLASTRFSLKSNRNIYSVGDFKSDYTATNTNFGVYAGYKYAYTPNHSLNVHSGLNFQNTSLSSFTEKGDGSQLVLNGQSQSLRNLFGNLGIEYSMKFDLFNLENEFAASVDYELPLLNKEIDVKFDKDLSAKTPFKASGTLSASAKYAVNITKQLKVQLGAKFAQSANEKRDREASLSVNYSF